MQVSFQIIVQCSAKCKWLSYYATIDFYTIIWYNAPEYAAGRKRKEKHHEKEFFAYFVNYYFGK